MARKVLVTIISVMGVTTTRLTEPEANQLVSALSTYMEVGGAVPDQLRIDVREVD